MLTFSELKSLARLYVPQAKPNIVDDTALSLIINEGALDVAFHSLCLKANTKFNAVADQSEYNLSSVVTKFLAIDKPGLWWNDGNQWKQLYPKTLKWLDENIPTWRDADSGAPRWYYQNGNTLGVHPAPADSLASGFWLYFAQAPTSMTENAHYPLHQQGDRTVAQEHLSPLAHSILTFVEWKLHKILNKDEESKMTREMFINEVTTIMAEIERRPDIEASSDVKYSGPRF